MSDQPDLPPSFNPQSYRRPAPRDQEKAETKRLGIIVVSIAALLVVAVLARSFFTAKAPDTSVQTASGTPEITAGGAPVKSAPANAGGLQVPGADQDVVGAGGAGAANGQLAPAAEAPAPDKLAAATPTPSAPIVATAPATPAAPANPAKTPTYVLPMNQPPLPVTEPASVAKSLATQDQPAPAPAPKKKHHRTHEATAPDITTTAEAAAPAAAAPAAAAPSAPAATGGRQVQLAAVMSEEDARKEWRRLKGKIPDLLAGHEAIVQTVDHNGTTMYRLRTDGFTDLSAAHDFCDQVKAKGERCSVF